MIRVVGAGFGRTGTMSLKTALEMLGFGPTYHMTEVFTHPEHIPIWQAAAEGRPVDWDALFTGYQSAVDWPTAAFYDRIMDAFPESKVILTVRDPARWYASVRSTIFPASTGVLPADPTPEQRAHRTMTDTAIWQGIFGGGIEDRAHALDVFDRHAREVEAHVPAGRLLVYEVGQGWEPLCRFLEVPVPPAPFPHLNDTASFNARREAEAHE
jgi:hypothetical protein